MKKMKKMILSIILLSAALTSTSQAAGFIAPNELRFGDTFALKSYETGKWLSVSGDRLTASASSALRGQHWHMTTVVGTSTEDGDKVIGEYAFLTAYTGSNERYVGHYETSAWTIMRDADRGQGYERLILGKQSGERAYLKFVTKGRYLSLSGSDSNDRLTTKSGKASYTGFYIYKF